MNIRKQAVAVLCLFGFAASTVFAQDNESIDGALIYDHDPSTKLGDRVFGRSCPISNTIHPAETLTAGPCAWSIPTARSWRSIRIRATTIWMVGASMR